MAHEPESENSEPSRRRWWHPRKTDLAFGAGLFGFLWMVVRGGTADPTLVYGSIALMGVSIAGRVDTFLDGKQK